MLKRYTNLRILYFYFALALCIESDWVLSHWAHFTVLRFIFVYALYACVGL